MKKPHLLLASTSIIVLVVIGSIAMPFLFVGMPSPLSSLDNKDINTHEVTIEITDSGNNSVFRDVYTIEPEAGIS
ncbi:hypothetical protein [Methanomethylovorans sp.]|uniref:hypothetical protein n=1 Tax=Methanomethylovorans sp. TaxID=2758717 RepID=UPI00351C796D